MEVSKFLSMLLTSDTLNVVKYYKDGNSTRGQHYVMRQRKSKEFCLLATSSPLSSALSTHSSVFCF